MNIFCTLLMHKGKDRRKSIEEESESSDTYYHHKRDMTNLPQGLSTLALRIQNLWGSL